jgi:hypothetical protein
MKGEEVMARNSDAAGWLNRQLTGLGQVGRRVIAELAGQLWQFCYLQGDPFG